MGCEANVCEYIRSLLAVFIRHEAALSGKDHRLGRCARSATDDAQVLVCSFTPRLHSNSRKIGRKLPERTTTADILVLPGPARPLSPLYTSTPTSDELG